MSVDAILIHLSNLSHLLRGAGAGKSADELSAACQLFEPYRGRKLKDVFATIAKAEEILRNPPGGAPKERRKSGKISAEGVAKVAAELVDLYRRAGIVGLTREDIDAAFANPDLPALTEKDLKALAPKLDTSTKIRGKDKLIHAMKQAVIERMGSLHRTPI